MMYVLRDTEYGHSADVLSSQSPAVVLKTRSSCSSSLSTLSRHSLRALVMSSGMLRRDISCRFIIIILARVEYVPRPS